MTGQDSGTPPQRRPDESMSLLNDLFAKPLEPGYEDVAARRRAAGEDPASVGQLRFSPALILGTVALGLLLTMAALQVRATADVVSAERQSLIERIHAEDDNVSRLQETVASLESEISGLEASLLENSAAGRQLRDEVRQLQARAGSMAVTGPGVVVTVDNAENPESYEDPNDALVQDIDLQQAVNGLWAAGAEAVSINGQRITALTAIRRVDNVMKINYRPTQAPYEITAIGDSRSLPSEFGDGTGASWLRYFSLPFDVQSAESLTVPAGSTSLIYAKPGEAT
ncbi:DUF881 domain-containing protein [Haloactinopolyspora alba]|uniref:DUF881 domain-containing protein n=1 Tax=Haloactinopolyspora alba TaxID=648780 RepID=UPI00101CE98C|nr:DUF881 domain-containing protein [Haloactinopolyspora alba]